MLRKLTKLRECEQVVFLFQGEWIPQWWRISTGVIWFNVAGCLTVGKYLCSGQKIARPSWKESVRLDYGINLKIV